MKNVPLKKKILTFSRSLPPTPGGTPSIMGNLLSQFSTDEAAAVRMIPMADQDEREDLGEHHVHHVGSRPGINWRLLPYWDLLMIPRTASQLCRIIKEEGCDAILAVYPREANILAAYLAAKKTGIDFYPYFHNTYLDNVSGIERVMASWLQPKILKRAKHVFLMSEGMEEFFETRYPEVRGKCSSLPHTLNEDIPDFMPPPKPPTSVRFALNGSVNYANLDATRRLVSAVTQLENSSMSFYTGVSESSLRKMGVLHGFAKVERVPRSELVARLGKSDIMLLPHLFEPNDKVSEAELLTIFPTKTIEYLISGRPILAHAPARSFVAKFLRKHECALVVDEPDEAALHSAIHALHENGELRSRLVRNALKTAEIFQGDRVAYHLRQIVGGRVLIR